MKKTLDQLVSQGRWVATEARRGTLGQPEEEMELFIQVRTENPGNGPEATICEMTRNGGFKFGRGVEPSKTIECNPYFNALMVAGAPQMFTVLRQISLYSKCQCKHAHGDNPDCCILLAEKCLAEIEAAQVIAMPVKTKP